MQRKYMTDYYLNIVIGFLLLVFRLFANGWYNIIKKTTWRDNHVQGIGYRR